MCTVCPHSVSSLQLKHSPYAQHLFTPKGSGSHFSQSVLGGFQGVLGTAVIFSGRAWISGPQGKLYGALESILRYLSGCGLCSLLCPLNVPWNQFCPSQTQN